MKNVNLVCISFLFFILLSGLTSAAYTTVHPHEGRIYMVGGDDEYITLRNSDSAKDPTYDELVSFIKSDKTDKKRYTNSYVCSDFAEAVHNNAEKAGIKAGWVTIDFKAGAGHACNAFNTKDKGIVYIDCTGMPGKNKGPCDKIITIKKGSKISTKSLYPPLKTWYGMDGIVKKYKIYW